MISEWFVKLWYKYDRTKYILSYHVIWQKKNIHYLTFFLAISESNELHLGYDDHEDRTEKGQNGQGRGRPSAHISLANESPAIIIYILVGRQVFAPFSLQLVS